MLVDAREIPQGQTIETDVCIVGAGAAGITLAREFAGQSMRVSILESGGLKFESDTHNLSAGQNVGLPYFPLQATRLRYFGGTTNHWGGICRPFDDIDFESRSWIPHSGWPLAKTDLQGYYERAQSVCRIPSSEWGADYWLSRDRFRPLPFLGDRLTTRVAQVVPSAERRFATNYREEMEQASNLTTYLHANLTELVTTETGGSVTHGNVACLSGNRFTIKARLFILASNAIENARLLLLSNGAHVAGLGNQHDQVGRYFMEHPRLVSGTLVPTNPRTSVGLYATHRNRGAMIEGYLALSEETLRKEQLMDVQIDLNPVYDPQLEDAIRSDDVDSFRVLLKAVRSRKVPDDFQRHLSNVLNDLTTGNNSAVVAAPFPFPNPDVIREVWEADPSERLAFLSQYLGEISLFSYSTVFGGLPIDRIDVTTRCEQAPNPDSRITLAPERDRLGLNRARLDWRLTSLEKRSMLRALEILGTEAGRSGVGRLQITLPDDDSWPETLHGGWHLMGTTRMSDDPLHGVVDRNCRVHGTENLFIAGSSVFPTAGSGTPTLTLVGLAIRLADHLKERLQ